MEKDRQGEPVDTGLLKKIISIYTYLSNEKITGNSINCLSDLEGKLLTASRAFFQQQGSKMMGNHSLVEYLTLSNNIYEAEEKRLNTYLNWPDLSNKIINEFQQELLLKN